MQACRSRSKGQLGGSAARLRNEEIFPALIVAARKTVPKGNRNFTGTPAATITTFGSGPIRAGNVTECKQFVFWTSLGGHVNPLCNLVLADGRRDCANFSIYSLTQNQPRTRVRIPVLSRAESARYKHNDRAGTLMAVVSLPSRLANVRSIPALFSSRSAITTVA